jgi:ABC-type antimicrobial peptide transport system permease subunit
MVIAQMSVPVIAGILIGAGVGSYIALMATRVDHRMAGFHSRFIISWGSMGFGAAMTVVLALTFAAWPALRACRTGIRALVSEGRG